MSVPTLSVALASRGLAHTPASNYRHDVVDGRGVVLFTGTASEVWAWLKSDQKDA